MAKEALSTPQEKVRFGPLKTVIYSLVPVLVLLALLETGARIREVWYPPMDVDLGQGFTGDSLVFSPDPFDSDYRVTHPRKTINFQDQRFAVEKPEGTVRIAMLGGSSVNYLDYELDQWPDRLRGQLPGAKNVEIINCGGLSYGSHRLVLVAAEVLAYDLDALLIYSGHNEFEELEQLDLANVSLVPVQRRLEVSALYRLLRDLAARAQLKQIKEDTAARELAAESPNTGRAWTHLFTPEEMTTRMQTFMQNLGRIISMCQERGVPVVIGTVPSNLWKQPPGADLPRWGEVEALYKAGRFDEGRDLAEQMLRVSARHQSSEAENEIIRELAEMPGVSLADVKTAVIAREPNRIPGETLFNDHCHLNPDGNRMLIETYEPVLIRALKDESP